MRKGELREAGPIPGQGGSGNWGVERHGRATAVAFAGRGADVVLAARRQEALEEAARAVRAQSRDALVVPVDLADEGAAKFLLEAALHRFGRIDILVAAAGVYYRCACEALTSADIERVMAVNFYGCVRCLLAVLPHMLERHQGSLVVVSSVDGKKGLPPDAAYVASKFALSGFAEVLRQELHGTGVRVSTIFPGRVDTPMIEDLRVPAISAKVPAERVAAAIVRAAETGRAETVVPLLGAKTLLLANAFSPRLGDALVRRLRLAGASSGDTGRVR
jgi:short-subunit dehydrogenase